MGDDSEWLKLPTDQKVEHKAWKARLTGYEECLKLFQTAVDPKSGEFSRYAGFLKKFVADNNAVAQEKGLEAVLVFLENAQIAPKTAGEMCSVIVSKCLHVPRAKTKEKGSEALLMYIELEKQDVVLEALLEGLQSKQPKVVVGCLQVLCSALHDFGSKIVPIKTILKPTLALLEDRDKTVRDETKRLLVEIYRWIGAALKPQLANLKPVLVTELEAEFEALPPTRAEQSRFLRSQQDLKAKAAARAAEGNQPTETCANDEVDAQPQVDPYELMDPVDILSKMPKDFYEKVEEKKWQDRREALEAVQKLVELPKLEQGDYNDLVRALKKVVAKDSNVMLVTLAAKCLTGLARGLRKKFSVHAVGCVEVILEKFREKKATVVEALREAIDAVYPLTTLEAINEIVVPSLDHKTPSVKAETAQFLARCFAKCNQSTLPKKVLKIYVTPLLKTINDTAPEVRDAAYEALGTAMKAIGEKNLAPFLTDVDHLKMAKIKESSEKAAQATAAGGSASTQPSAPVAAAPEVKKPQSAPAAAKAKKPESIKQPTESTEQSVSKGESGGAKGTAGAKSAAAKKKPDAKGKKPGGKDEFTEQILSDETIEEKAASLLSADNITALASANWKDRLGAIEKLSEAVHRLTKPDIPAQVCVRLIGMKTGLKDNNFQVLKLKVDLIAYLAKSANFSRQSASFCLTDLAEKIGDAKNGSSVQEALSCMAEAISLDFVCQEVLRLVFEQKNPKNQAESLAWLATAIKEFGLKVEVKSVIEYVKKALAAQNPTVRQSGITVLTTLYLYLGPAVRSFFDGEKPALLQQIDAEFEKVKGEKPPVATRGVQPQDAAEDAHEPEDDKESAAANVVDLLPRTDISGKITDQLINDIGDKNWKTRNEGLQKVVAIINEAKYITADIGSLPEALKPRITDSNKILSSTALNICQMLAIAMGPHIKNHVRILGPALIACLGDAKPQVRSSTLSVLAVWVQNAGFMPFLEGEMISDSLKTENPYIRAELLGWMAEQLPLQKKVPIDLLGPCISHIFTCLEDRNADVRKKANDVLLPFMTHTGYDAMLRQTSKVKPASKDQIVTTLEKVRALLPAKTAKPAAATVVSAASAPPNAQQKTSAGNAKPAITTKAPVKVEDDADDDEDKSAKSTAAKKPAANSAAAKGKPGSAATAKSGSKKDGDKEDTSAPIVASATGKEQRFKDEKARKILKWNFTSPTQEFVEQLQQQMSAANFGKPFTEMLFHADFKFHIKALEILLKECEGSMDATVSNFDLILKWLTLRFFDTNTSVLLKALEYLQTLFTRLSDIDYHLNELEASAFLPYFINKVGDPKDNVRRDIRTILKIMCKTYPASQMFVYLTEGIKSKNSKQRSECLEELGCLIEIHGINVCRPSPAQALKVIAQQIGDRDNGVRSAALNTIVVAYGVVGEVVYKHIGQLNDKEQAMLEERIKRAGKTKPAAATAPPAKVSPEERPPTAKPAPTTSAPTNTKQPEVVDKKVAARRSFVLDVEEEVTQADKDILSGLLPHDLAAFDEPVVLPKTRMRPPSPSFKLLASSTDAKSAIDLVISQVASNDLTTSIQALAQLDTVLRDADKAEVLTIHVDQLLVVCSLQFRMLCNKHIDDDSTPRETITRLFQALLATLFSLLGAKTLPKKASRDMLKDIVQVLISILLDQRIPAFEQGDQIIRSINMLTVKIIDKCDCTNIISALMKLMHECVASENCSSKFLELVMKCLWKTVRLLPDVINELSVDRIFGDIHIFLKTFPTSSWRNRPSDMPLKTVKTLLHNLVKQLGLKALNHLSLVEAGSEVEAYVKKHAIKSSSAADIQNDGVNNNAKNAQLNPNNDQISKEPSRMNRSTHDILAEIFKKIGSKENTREGLNDLYDFKLKYPEANLDPFLRKSSTFFQRYIERGLENIAQEREGKFKQSSMVTPSSSSNQQSSTSSSLSHSSATSAFSSSSSRSDDSLNPQAYMDRLKVLRARCGLDNGQTLSASSERPASTSNSQQSISPTSHPSTATSGDLSGLPTQMSSTTVAPPMTSSADTELNSTGVDELRRRLERVRGGIKN